MEHVGQIFKQSESQVAELSATDNGNFTTVIISIDGLMVIQFPLPTGSDANEIALRAGNVINQTGLSPSQCRVDVQPVEL